jgi:hypothetical protein
MTMRTAVAISLAITGAALASGCADELDGTELVEGKVVLSSISLGASETAVSSLAFGKIVMTYNEDHSGFITFNNNSRQVFRGASMMGFVQLNLFDGSKNVGRVLPPSEWAVLWGDPAVTRSRANTNNLYIANVAIPEDKFPGMINGDLGSGAPANFCGGYIGGACIARSSTEGRTFNLTNNDCVRRTTQSCPFGTFYDGSDLETSPEGRVYAAFADISRQRIDVWMAGGHNSPFTRITDPPAPDVNGSIGHPRIKIGPGGLYLLYLKGQTLLITRYTGGASFNGSWTPNTVVSSSATGLFTSVPFPNLPGTNRIVRTGPGYDLDIGLNEGNNSTGGRVVHTQMTSTGKIFVAVKSCFTDAIQPISCGDRGSGWMTSNMTGMQFAPTIAAQADNGNWWISFLNTNAATNNTVEVWSGQLSVGFQGVGSMRVRREVAAQTPCPDLRGYWGDYDTMAIGIGTHGYRGFTDSTITPCERRNFFAQPMRASLARWTAAF